MLVFYFFLFSLLFVGKQESLSRVLDFSLLGKKRKFVTSLNRVSSHLRTNKSLHDLNQILILKRNKFDRNF